MSLRKKMNRIRHIDSLIFKKATGDPKSLSKKISLSVSGTAKIIREMKNEGFPISYCRVRKTYFYTKEGRMISNLFDTENLEEE